MATSTDKTTSDGKQVLAHTIDGFFSRSGLPPHTRNDCLQFLKLHYPGKVVALPTSQGFCSMTVVINDDTVVQFRPCTYGLDLQLAQAAKLVYKELAPETRYITTLQPSGLLVFEMERLAGVSYEEFRVQPHSIDIRLRLCLDLARFIARSWHGNAMGKPVPLGRVGKTIIPRLKSLSTDLPLRFQATARHILQDLHHIEALPWVLTHGDIVAGNIMVNPQDGALTGLVDWAEAEYLPFGICLYGLEEILGKVTAEEFRYHPDAEQLRDSFWIELVKQIPGLRASALLATVKLVRDLGVLLWHGIAFDNGRIDRVVQEEVDIDEIFRLDAFLDVGGSISEDVNSKI